MTPQEPRANWLATLSVAPFCGSRAGTALGLGTVAAMARPLQQEPCQGVCVMVRTMLVLYGRCMLGRCACEIANALIGGKYGEDAEKFRSACDRLYRSTAGCCSRRAK